MVPDMQVGPLLECSVNRPTTVTWEVTRRFTRRSSPSRERGGFEKSYTERLIEQIADFRPEDLILTGNDPTARPDIGAIVRQATARGLRVTMAPNPSLGHRSPDFSELRRAGVARMVFRLDGATATSHDAFHTPPADWITTLTALRQARAAGMEVGIDTAITRAFIEELPEFFFLIPRLLPARWNLSAVVSDSRVVRQLAPEPEAVESAFEQILDFSKRSGIPVTTLEAPHFQRIAVQRLVGASDLRSLSPRPLTPDSRARVFISHRGEIQPCGALPIACGNAKCHDLADVYQKSPVFRALRDPGRLRGKCGRCEFRAVCGGSRARAYAMTRDFLAADPLCPHQPKRELS